MIPRRIMTTLACIGVAVGAHTANSGCLNPADDSCATIGCVDQATVDLESTTGSWASGTYELTAANLGDGSVDTCSLQIVDAPSPTGVVFATCNGGLGLTFLAAVTCQTFQNGNAMSQRCTPVPGQFHQTLTIPGTPARVALTLSRDGEPLLDTLVPFTYGRFQPNGPRCGSGCQEASAQLMVVAEMGSDSGSTTDSGVGAPGG